MTQTPRRFSALSAAEKADIIAAWLEEHKARNIVLIDLSEQSSLTDVVVIAEVSSIRQGQSLAEGLFGVCRDNNFEFLRTEGHTTGQWILVDLNDVVVHLFLSEARGLYNLEGLWNGSPVLRDGRPVKPGDILQ